MPDKRSTLPSVEYLHQCFEYDPDTGVLRWKRRPQWHFSNLGIRRTWNSKYAGTVAGRIDVSGYSSVGINDRDFRAHRVIWKMMTGEEPPLTIDHMDCDKANNRWWNLRIATKQEQTWNAGPHKDSISGVKGVYRVGSKWYARICINGVTHRHRGGFDTSQEAGAAYEAMARKVHGEFYRVMDPVWAATQ